MELRRQKLFLKDGAQKKCINGSRINFYLKKRNFSLSQKKRKLIEERKKVSKISFSYFFFIYRKKNSSSKCIMLEVSFKEKNRMNKCEKFLVN